MIASSRKSWKMSSAYLHPPDNAIIRSVDEKCQIQALDRTQLGLPWKKGRCGTMTHDYKRHGSTTLFAAMNTQDGSVIDVCMPTHNRCDWIRFLKLIDRRTPPHAAGQATPSDHGQLRGPQGPRGADVAGPPPWATWLFAWRRYWTGIWPFGKDINARRPAGPASCGARPAAKALGPVDDESRAGADLLVDPPDVLPQDPDADQLDAPKEKDQDDQGRVADGKREAAQLHDQVGERDQERCPRDHETELGAERQGVGRKAEDPVESDPQGPEKPVVLGLPGEPRGALEGQQVLPEANDRDHAAQEAVALAQPDDLVCDPPGHETEVAGVRGDPHVRDLVDHLVAGVGHEPLDPGLARPAGALRQDDVVALAPLADHLGDQLGGVLHVDVHHDDGLARGILHPGEAGHRLAEPARELKKLDAVVPRAVLQDHVLGPVGRGVHREYDLIVLGDAADDGADPADELRNVLLLPEYGYD